MRSLLFRSVVLLTLGHTLEGAQDPASEASLHAGASTPQGRHELAIAELKRVAGPALEKLAASPDTRWFGQDLLASKERMADLMYSGPLDDPAKSLRILAAIWNSDPKGLAARHEQTTAAAVALMFAKDKWPEDKAVDRYRFYRDSRLTGKLHPQFDSFDTWEKRFVVSGGSNGGWSEVGGAWGDDSLVWLRDNVKLTAKEYIGACWQAPYRGFNLFGDSVQGPDYYRPFSHVIHAERVRDVGGVCGSLSHYGANAARANGLPATTMGEPGHCAYAVRLSRGDWQPAYTLSWQRGLHISLWGHTWTQLILQEKIFDDKEACDRCTAHVFQARAVKAKNPELAELAYTAALEAQPINYPAWCESVDFLKTSRKPTAESWEVVGKSVSTALAAYPEVAWEVLSRFDEVALAALPAERRLPFLLKYHEIIAKQEGPVMWEYGQALDAQMKALGGDRSKEARVFRKGVGDRGGFEVVVRADDRVGPAAVRGGWFIQRAVLRGAGAGVFLHHFEHESGWREECAGSGDPRGGSGGECQCVPGAGQGGAGVQHGGPPEGGSVRGRSAFVGRAGEDFLHFAVTIIRKTTGACSKTAVARSIPTSRSARTWWCGWASLAT